MDTIAFASIQAVESFQFCLLTLRLEEACEADGLSLVYYTASDESALLSTRKGALTHYSQTLPLFFDPEHHRTILFLRRHWHMLFRQKRCRPFSKSPIISISTPHAPPHSASSRARFSQTAGQTGASPRWLLFPPKRGLNANPGLCSIIRQYYNIIRKRWPRIFFFFFCPTSRRRNAYAQSLLGSLPRPDLDTQYNHFTIGCF
ncbi:hypothetical protein IWX48DRAFT_93513 [Phyllosticta citricarpa]